MIDTRGAGTPRVSAVASARRRAAPSRRLGGYAVRQPTRRQVAALADRMTGAWNARHAGAEPTRADRDRIARELSADARWRGL
jgi:hypothetical protein